MSKPFNPFQTCSRFRFPPEARGYAFWMSIRRIFFRCLANIYCRVSCFFFSLF